MVIDTQNLSFQELGERVRAAEERELKLIGCTGQRYIGCGLSEKKLTIEGIPGNALGAYLDGGELIVHGNAQDAVGDTMNDGRIIIHGMAGDAAGYAMRGGSIFIKGDTGYRAGIHMKAYEEKQPLLVIGGCAGSFLGEYQAGGTILVLGEGQSEERPIVGNFCGTGMHGGRIVLRCAEPPRALPAQVKAAPATAEELAELRPVLEAFCTTFGGEVETLLQGPFLVLTPNTANPYHQLYTQN